MQERLLEVLFEHQLRLLLAVYDPDRVFRYIGNNCTLFGVNHKQIQFVIVTILNQTKRDMRDCEMEVIAICRKYNMRPFIIMRTLKLDDKQRYLVYNYKYRSGVILAPEYDDDIRETLRIYLNQCHILKEIL